MPSVRQSHICAHLRLSPQIRIWDWCPTVAAPHGGWVTRRLPHRSDGSSGVLAVLTDPQLRDELDRVAAAVGVRVVHAGAGSVGEQEDLVGGRGGGARRGGGGSVWPGRAAAARARQRAHRHRTRDGDVGGGHRGRRPACAEAARARTRIDPRTWPKPPSRRATTGLRGEVVAVIGGCGGAGASLFAVALAQAATDALLVDLDPWGGGIDLLVGGEATPGLRWPDLALQGGRLNWSVGARGAAATPRDQFALGHPARVRTGCRAGGRRRRRRPPRGSHRGLRSSPPSHRCHPDRAGRRRSGRRGQPVRRPGVRGDRDDRPGAFGDQSQPRAGRAGAVAGGIAGSGGRRHRRPAAAGVDEGPAAARRATGTRWPAIAIAISARGGRAPGAGRAARVGVSGRTAGRRERLTDRTRA